MSDAEIRGLISELGRLIDQCDAIASALGSPIVEKLTNVDLGLRRVGDQLTRLADSAADRLRLDKAIAESYSNPR